MKAFKPVLILTIALMALSASSFADETKPQAGDTSKATGQNKDMECKTAFTSQGGNTGDNVQTTGTGNSTSGAATVTKPTANSP